MEGKQELRRIELPTEALAEQLQGHLQEMRFTGATYDKARNVIQFPDNMSSSQWSNIKVVVEEWAKGRHLEMVESLRLQTPKPVLTQEKPKPSVPEAGEKQKLERLTPQQAHERYNYLQSKPFSELTDAEYDERLALAESLSKKSKAPKQ